MPNIAKLIATNFAKYGKPLGVKPCALTKSTPGIRTPGAISAGTNPVSTTYSATGFLADLKTYKLEGTLIDGVDRVVVLFGASIQGGAVPAAGDRIAIGGETLTIVKDGVDSDGVKATHTCQCRK